MAIEEEIGTESSRNTYRRRFLRGVGAAGLTGMVAGCLGDDNGDDNGDNGTGNGDNGDNGTGNGDGSASFTISDLQTSAETVPRGDELTVTATIENDGDAEGTQSVAIESDGEELQSQDVDLGSGDSTEVSFDVDTADLEPDEYEYTVTTEDDDGNVTVTVEPKPATFEVSGLEPEEATITEGETVDVSATVANTGDEAGSQTVEFRIDNEVLASQSVDLDPGGETSVSFEAVETGEFSPGEYTSYGVYSADNSATGTLTIEQELNPDDWAEVDSIRLLGRTSGWIGAEPAMIEGIENPTILLFEGQEYELTWENDDGNGHNIQVRDADENIVDDLSTEVESGQDVVQTLEFEASSEMASYVCNPHQTTMRGSIETE